MSLICPAADSPLLSLASITETIRELVAINSVNPNYGGPQGGERAALEWACRFLRKAGLYPIFCGPNVERPNLRVRLEGDNPGPPLLLETHVDTVSVQGMTIPPFAARIEGRRLWGRGSTDAKAQVAAMLHALAAWARSGQRPPRSVELVLVSDEEYGFGGAKALLTEGVEAAGIIIGEPTDLRVVTTHKGTVRIWIEVEGVAAHASKPHLGVSAIYSAATLIELIENEYTADLRRRRAPLLEPPTISIGLIKGGIQANLVPPSCRIHLDRRLIPSEDEKLFVRELESLLEKARQRRPGFRAKIEPPTLFAPPLQTDPSHPLVIMAGQAAAAQGIPPEPIGVDYATDASILSATGLPVIVMGPGSIDQAHTADEFVELDQVAAGARLFTDLIGRA